jgi:uncharacterized protein (TIGR02996 family)
MNHPDWPAFLAAIVANPDDDTLRLVAADFLEENGDPGRAEFVRLQVALARLEDSGLGQTVEAGALRRRQRDFLNVLCSAPRFWIEADCPTSVLGEQAVWWALRAISAERLTWRRGFVEWVRCPVADWLQHGVAIRKRSPVRRVILSDCAAVARDTWTAGLDALRGLGQVDLKYAGYTTGTPVEQGSELSAWLRERLPGTRVNTEITPF